MSRGFMKELDEWIKKIERITSASKIDSIDLIKVIEFLESIDEENRVVLKVIRERDPVDIEEVKEVLQYYNVIPSELSLSERKSKVFIKKGLFTKTAFDVFKYPMPESVRITIEKIKKIYE